MPGLADGQARFMVGKLTAPLNTGTSFTSVTTIVEVAEAALKAVGRAVDRGVDLRAL